MALLLLLAWCGVPWLVSASGPSNTTDVKIVRRWGRESSVVAMRARLMRNHQRALQAEGCPLVDNNTLVAQSSGQYGIHTCAQLASYCDEDGATCICPETCGNSTSAGKKDEFDLLLLCNCFHMGWDDTTPLCWLHASSNYGSNLYRAKEPCGALWYEDWFATGDASTWTANQVSAVHFCSMGSALGGILKSRVLWCCSPPGAQLCSRRRQISSIFGAEHIMGQILPKLCCTPSHWRLPLCRDGPGRIQGDGLHRWRGASDSRWDVRLLL